MAYCPRCDADNPDEAQTCFKCHSPMTAGTMVMGVVKTARPKVSLRVVRADGGPESVVAMKGDVLTCGVQGDLALHDDPFVAPVQARFFFSGARLAVEDIGGGNGVFMRLKSERDIAMGGELRLGRQRLVVEPIPQVSAGPGNTTHWGSPDPGYRFRLVQILEGGLRGGAYPLKDGENTVGREIGDITFPTDGFVSGRHAQVQVRPDRLVIRDVGSSNGTFVRLAAPTFVDSGEQFLIGRSLVRIDIGA